MKKDSIYYRQVQLLVRVLPLLDSEKCFALKGGTAINLFYREQSRVVLIAISDKKIGSSILK